MHPLNAFVFAVAFATTATARSAIVEFDLLGKAGAGLLPGNENHAMSGLPGTGGERGLGILFNDATRVLSIDIGWGSGNGFTDLSSAINGGHIHGPTASGGTGSFTQTASVLIGIDGLAGFNSSRTAGGFTGNITLSSTQATDLLAGKLYINIHTSTNGSGEIRGNLVAVPEPACAGLLLLGGGLLARRRRTNPGSH